VKDLKWAISSERKYIPTSNFIFKFKFIRTLWIITQNEKILSPEEQKNIKFSFLIHKFNRQYKWNIWISNLVSMGNISTNSHYKHKQFGAEKFKVLFQYSPTRPEQSNIVLANITITCCSPDRDNYKIYNTTSFPSLEPALHTPSQRNL
jgi:hypothetical protein